MSAVRRDAAKKALRQIHAWIRNADDCSDQAEAESVAADLELRYQEFTAFHDEILAVSGDNEREFQKIEGDDAAGIYKSARAGFDALFLRLATHSNTHENVSVSSEDVTTPPPAVVTPAVVARPSPVDTMRANAERHDILARKDAGDIYKFASWATRTTPQMTNKGAVMARAEMLEALWQSYRSSVFIEWSCDHDAVYDGVMDAYLDAKEKLITLMAHFTTERQPAANATSTKTADIKLPRIEIPKFSGDYHTWTAFYDLFSSMVHTAPTLSGVQKMHYLRSCVEGEAAQLIRSYKVTEANYAEAWETLTARYNNRRLIISAHLEQLFHQPKANVDSAVALRNQLDTFTEAVRALSALNQPTEHWDALLVHMFMAKVDSSTKHEWEMSLVDDAMPTFAQLCSFIARWCRSLEASSASTSGRFTSAHTNRSGGSNIGRQTGAGQTINKQTRAHKSFVSTNANGSCLLCNGEHQLGSCPSFVRLSPGERYRKAKLLGVCYNCLRPDHQTTACTASSCRKCNGRHHSLLHYDNDHAKKPEPAPSTVAVGTTDNMLILLATAVAHIGVSFGTHDIRILLDTGSQTSFITERCTQRVGLTRSKANIAVSGLGMNTAGRTRGRVTFTMQSTHNKSNRHHVHAFVLQNITNKLPNEAINKGNISFLPSVPEFADPQFDVPGEIDVLLGADVIGELLLDGRLHDSRDKALYAQNTTLGWVIAGPIPGAHSGNIRTMVSLASCVDLDAALQRFWALEEIGSGDDRTAEELACEEHFAATHRRDADGRYIVELPFRPGAAALGNSKTSAARSLQQLERRFDKNPQLREQYTQFINEYIELHHMSRVDTEVDESCSFYLPHHPVFKLSSSSTKIRVVFDASRKTTTGTSLNHTLMVGPKLQADLVDILLRFRTHAVALCGDLVKMYRQIRTSAASSEHQRILWRPSPQHVVHTYRLNTVTYGTAAASYLATKALQQLAVDEAQRFPVASAVALTDFYVDDLMTGCDNIADALQLQNQLILLMQAGGFTLSKWASNHNALLENVPAQQREVQCPLEIHADEAVKALGLGWNPSSDCFQYRVTWPSSSIDVPTKRSILSEVASLFDPLGLLAPLIVAAKIFLQVLWAEGLEWDQPLPHTLADRWHGYRGTLTAIHDINIPRWLGTHSSHAHQLHAFCDASELAYAAVVYLRSTNAARKTSVRIITARTKVAPVKKISVPRLELCGAVLLAKLVAHVKQAINMPHIECHAWCDSTVALAWIRKPSHCWQTFVANRVSAIQALTAPDIWHHVPGEHNPADIASRGLLAPDLVRSSLWWEGPAWLVEAESCWPRTGAACTTNLDEKKVITSLLVSSPPQLDVLQRFSSFARMQRVTAYMQRFAHNCRQPTVTRKHGALTTNELNESIHHWARATQSSSYAAEIASLQAGQVVGGKSALIKLDPFLDDVGILRVGGRIGNAPLPYDTRHPIILPKISHLSSLLITAAHQRNLHAGPQLTIAALRQRYWIVSARSIVKQIIHRCSVCIRHKHTLGKQFMAPLPERRATPTRAFLSAGVDYAGPIIIKLQPGRGTKTSKAYIALFVCFATKALHLELVSSLSTDAFLAAFRRFVARRGQCAHLHSDCGTNFIGAAKELRRLQAEVARQLMDPSLADILARDGTQWHFNPPGAPSFGGIWEAGVKSVKHHLRRALGASLLTFEELYTTLTQIEAILNSRPLGPMSDDAADMYPLTPGHFLIGEPVNTVPDPMVPENISPLRRWQHLQLLTQHFWNRWRREYVTSLQQRHKWMQRAENINVGALALIADETLPPAKWALGRVVEVHTGPDGIVRVVTLRHKSGLIKRPLLKLVVFPNTHDTENNN